MAAESEMSAFSKIRKAATEREWCPERPSAEAAEPHRRNERRGPKHRTPQSERQRAHVFDSQRPECLI